MTRPSVYCVYLLISGLLLSTPAWAQPGDPLRGEALYVGAAGFAAGGAPCLACHGIAGHELGHAAGANYGPDLTTFYENYGEEGVAAVLEDLSFESMVAIYADRSLTDTERADLTAFFGKVATAGPAKLGSALGLHALLATLALMILIGALGWRRLQGVRRPMLEQAGNTKGESA